jgi:hypothetical protein
MPSAAYSNVVIPEFHASEISGTQDLLARAESVAPGSRLSRFALGREDR